MYKYERIIYWSNDDNAFIVEVPELPGCMADGKTIEEAIANAEIIIKEWIEVTLERGLEVPEPKCKAEQKKERKSTMKRKIAMLILVLSLVVSATACGGNSEETDSPTQEPENKEEIVDVPDEPEESVYFKEDVLKIDMATIKLTGFEIAPPNQELGEEKSTLIITYEFTNDSDDVMQPGTTWITCFDATQETEATIDSLNVAMAPQDEKYTEMNNVSV